MNVVLLLLDTLRYDFLGFNGNPWIRTPNLDRLAERSIVFDRAMLGSYPCMPARRDLLTGCFEFPFRGWGPMEPEDRSLAAVAGEGGVTSMLVTDHYHLWEKGSGNYHFDFSGYDFIRGQEYDRWVVEPGGEPSAIEPVKQVGHLAPGLYEQNRRNVAGRRTEADYFPALVMSRAADWVERNRARDRFLLVVDCFDPHEPFDPPSFYTDLYDPGYTGLEVTWPTYGWNALDEAETRHARALYAGEITLVDRWVGVLLHKLEQIGRLEDTTIVMTTDHGHMFGEHGLMGKPWSELSDSNMYREVAHIPLLVYHPHAARPGRRVADLVQPVDVYPTILEALGLDPPAGIDGGSLLRHVTSEDARAVRGHACYGRFGEALNVTDGEWTMFIWPPSERNEPLLWHSRTPPESGATYATGPYRDGHYPVRCARGPMASQLFDVRSDPGERHDLLADHPDVAERLRAAAAEFLRDVSAPPEQFERLGLDAA
jgi:arylsulfatase A-like enzyme